MSSDKKLLFKKALAFVLKWEGGFVDDPDDRGGATNKGITQSTYNAFLKAHGETSRSVKNISQSEVEAIYYKNYWLAVKCDTMSDKFAVVSFDTAVNMGTGRVAAFLQAAEYKHVDKFIAAREAKYKEFAQYGNQKKFLKGWLNRLNDLKTFIKNI